MTRAELSLLPDIDSPDALLRDADDFLQECPDSKLWCRQDSHIAEVLLTRTVRVMMAELERRPAVDGAAARPLPPRARRAGE